MEQTDNICADIAECGGYIVFEPLPDDREALTCQFHTKKDYWVVIDKERVLNIYDLNSKLMHEYGHCATGALHHVDSPYETTARMEERAWRKAITEYLPFEDLNYAIVTLGMGTPELADYFGFNISLIDYAISYYKEACGYQFGHEYH